MARVTVVPLRPPDEIVATHLADPTLPATELAHAAGGTLEDVRVAYRRVREDGLLQEHLRSPYYPHRHKTALAARTIAEWSADPDRPARLLDGRPVTSRTVELHASKGTCTYSCQMCLWSDQKELTYIRRGLRSDGLLTTSEWCDLLDQLHQQGVHTVVLSGGGEVLLNRDLPTILSHIRRLGLAAHLYTTGYHLPPDRPDHPLWDEIAHLDRVRFSIHSPTAATYDQITQLPARLEALDRVTTNIGHLRAQRHRLGTSVQIGIGFVAQPANIGQIEAMADYAASVGSDFLDLRKDEVDVTNDLTPEQIEIFAQQISAVRTRAETGSYGRLRVDLADELIALANGQPVERRRRTPECLAKYFRPTISPYGIVAPCDLIAEPRFANQQLTIGNARAPMDQTLETMAHKTIPDACTQCMPSSRTGNAVYHKLLTDLRDGLALHDQPFTGYSLAP